MDAHHGRIRDHQLMAAILCANRQLGIPALLEVAVVIKPDLREHTQREQCTPSGEQLDGLDVVSVEVTQPAPLIQNSHLCCPPIYPSAPVHNLVWFIRVNNNGPNDRSWH